MGGSLQSREGVPDGAPGSFICWGMLGGLSESLKE